MKYMRIQICIGVELIDSMSIVLYETKNKHDFLIYQKQKLLLKIRYTVEQEKTKIHRVEFIFNNKIICIIFY